MKDFDEFVSADVIQKSPNEDEKKGIILNTTGLDLKMNVASFALKMVKKSINIFDEKELAALARPAQICEAQSQLHQIAQLIAIAAPYLKETARPKRSCVENIQFVTVGAFSAICTFLLRMQRKLPMTPFPGETLSVP